MDYDKRNHKRGVTPFQAFKILLLTGVICVGIVFAGCSDDDDEYEGDKMGGQGAGSSIAGINTVNLQMNNGGKTIKDNTENADPSKVNDVVQAGKTGFNRLASKGEVTFDMPLTNTGSRNYAGAAFNTLNKLNVLDEAAATGLGGSISGNEMNTEYSRSGDMLNVKTKRESVTNLNGFGDIKHFKADESHEGIILVTRPVDSIVVKSKNTTVIVADKIHYAEGPAESFKLADGGAIDYFNDPATAPNTSTTSTSTDTTEQTVSPSVGSGTVLPSQDNSILSVTGQMQGGNLFDFEKKAGSEFAYSHQLDSSLQNGDILSVKVTAKDPKAKLGWVEGSTVNYVAGSDGKQAVIGKELISTELGLTGSKEFFVKVMSESGVEQQYTIEITWYIP